MKQLALQIPMQRFASLFSTLLFLIFSTSLALATDCDNLQVNGTNTGISITELTAPIEILKVYKTVDDRWEQIYECSGDCEPEIKLEALEAGTYHVELQAFDKDWNALCNRRETVEVGGCFCPLVYLPVCGIDGKTYGNACEAACAGVEVVAEGECAPVTTCDLLARITFNTDLCSQCLSEIAVYAYEDKSYLVYLAQNITCADVPNVVVDCETGEEFCNDGGGLLPSTCGDFFEKAEKIETVLKDDCEPCICPKIYAPVCGVDGKTYGNECEAACAGVAVASEGECPTVTTCDLLSMIDLDPNLCDQCLTEIATYTLNNKAYLAFIAQNITCADGQTRVVDCDTGEEFCVVGGIAGINTCEDFFQKAEKTGTVLEEDCRPCFCPAVYAPVCGVDGKTYGNRCEAECAGVEIEAEGECPCLCPTVALPVCGADGKTYINACQAACAGVAVAFEGTCEECLGRPKEDIACPAIFDPVCGCNGETYSNACEAEVAGVKKWTAGPCADSNECKSEPNVAILCTTEFDPVCGCDGVTYTNACLAEAAGVKRWTEGACADDCQGEPNPLILCTTEYDPVCGCDGKTYSNACVAEAAGIKSWTEGACPCECPENYDPVCGVDGKTYGNECEAECAGVAVAYQGECGDSNNDCETGECALLARILLNPNLCEDCLTEVATYCYRGATYLVFIGDFMNCDNAKTTVLSCATGDTFCEMGGDQTGLPCGDFFEEAIKLETILMDECEDDCKGLPTPGAPCPEIYEPVCGCDGMTYDNECTAQSLGIKQWTPGVCEQEIIKCGDITIAYGNGKIKMTGQPNQSYFFKVHDQNNNWAEIFDCSEDCGSEQTAMVPPGKYYVKVYTASWERACEQEVIIRDENEPTRGRFTCGMATVTYGNGQVLFEGVANQAYHLKVLDEGYNDVFACMWGCGSTITAKGLEPGRYLVRGMNKTYDIICEEWISLGNSFDNRSTPNTSYSVYPNPAQEELFIKIRATENQSGTLQIVNAFGQVMSQQVFDNQYDNIIEVDLSTYQNGLYYYQIQIPKRPIITGKFLVNRLY